MKRFAFLVVTLGLFAGKGLGADMDALAIKQLLKQMEASYPKAAIFDVGYTVSDLRTDAFYDRRRQMIALMQDTLAREGAEAGAGGGSDAFNQRKQRLQGLIKSFQRELTFPRECTYITDYSMDGTGFYMKQLYNFTAADGKKSSQGPSIYVSNGKLMGTFYPAQAQGVIQPATERPQVPNDYWLDIAYEFYHRDIPANFETWDKLALADGGSELVVSAQNPGPGQSVGYRELHIDKSSLMPVKLTSIAYNSLGKLSSETMKFWQYQDFSGVRLPKAVVEQGYYMDPKGNWNLETQESMTIDEFALTARNASDEFNALLKSNYSIFDEITGTHYLSGNPANMLDNLSK